MTELNQEIPTTPEPPEPPSPLGLDPEDSVVGEVESSPEVEETPEEPSTVTLSPEEYEKYQEVRQAYDNIVNDDKAMSILRDYYEGKTMEPQEPTNIDSQEALLAKIAELESNQQKLAKNFESASEHIANLAVAEFEKGNPDFSKHRAKVGQIMGEYPGMSLDRALALARAEAGESQTSSSPPPVNRPQRPVVETTAEAALPKGPASLEDIQAKILDSKNVPMDKAIDIALRAAQNNSGG